MKEQYKAVSLAMALEQIIWACMGARMVSQSNEGLHLKSEDDERNAISSFVAILELVDLHGNNIQRCLRGELDPIAIYNQGNAASEEAIINWNDCHIKLKKCDDDE